MIEKTDFSYRTLKGTLSLQRSMHHNEDATIIARRVNAFYQISCLDPSEKYSGNTNYGWKFHVALGTDRNYENNLDKAWNIMLEIAQKYHLSMTKIIADHQQMGDIQQGKEMTIYTGPDVSKTPELWCMILSELTVKLGEAMVLPGQHAKSHQHKLEHEVSGNPYLTYRYQHPEETEASGEELNKKVLAEPINPYAKMDLSFIACARRMYSAERSLARELNDLSPTMNRGVK